MKAELHTGFVVGSTTGMAQCTSLCVRRGLLGLERSSRVTVDSAARLHLKGHKERDTGKKKSKTEEGKKETEVIEVVNVRRRTGERDKRRMKEQKERERDKGEERERRGGGRN